MSVIWYNEDSFQGEQTMKEELLRGLTDEQIEKVKACKSQDELLKLAKKEGIELTSEQLEAVSGGACSTDDKKDEKNHRKIDS